jgi:hypothetical protein
MNLSWQSASARLVKITGCRYGAAVAAALLALRKPLSHQHRVRIERTSTPPADGQTDTACAYHTPKPVSAVEPRACAFVRANSILLVFVVGCVGYRVGGASE